MLLMAEIGYSSLNSQLLHANNIRRELNAENDREF
jgi:hypothetical protein